MAGAALSEELMEKQEAQADYLAPLIAWLTVRFGGKNGN